MTSALVTVTISADEPSTDGTWLGVDTWGRRVRVRLRTDVAGPRTVRRGQAVRGVLSGDLVTDARF